MAEAHVRIEGDGEGVGERERTIMHNKTVIHVNKEGARHGIMTTLYPLITYGLCRGNGNNNFEILGACAVDVVCGLTNAVATS